MGAGHGDPEGRIRELEHHVAALERRITHLEAERESFLRAARATAVVWADMVENYYDPDLITIPDADAAVVS